MEIVTSRHELEVEFTDANRALQSLVLTPGVLRHPEDHLTGTIYTKGAWFLHFLEQRFGRPAFDGFLRGYFKRFSFQSISSGQFVDYARRHLLLAHPGKVREEEFQAWLKEPGIPSFAPRVLSPRLDAVDAVRTAWLRRRMVLPTFRALAATSEGRAFARSILDRARPGLHPITLRAVEEAIAEPAGDASP